jgi:hypothetical protein
MEAILGIALGVVIVVVAPKVPGLRGASKAVVKGGQAVVDRSKEVFSTTGENWADLVAQARQERGAAGSKPAVVDAGEAEVAVSES